MKNNYRKKFSVQGAWMISILFFATIYSAKATSYVVWSNGAGNGIWSDATNWAHATAPSGLPAAGDAVLIPDSSAGDPILDAGDLCASLTIESTHHVTVNPVSGYGLVVGGNISGAGSLDLTAYSGTSSITVGGNISISVLKLRTTTVNVAGDFTPGTLTPGSTSTVTLNGSSLQNISANTFNSISDNNTGTNTNISTLTGNIIVNGDISGTGKLVAATFNVTVLGNISLAGYNAGSGTTTLTGTLSVTTFTCGTSLMILNGTGSQISGTYTFNNLEIDNTGTSETFNFPAIVLKNLSGTGTIDAGAETVTVDGNVTIAAIIPNNTVYILNGTAANQNITHGYTFYELHLSNTASVNPGATLTGGDVTVTHILALTSGLLTIGTNNLIVSSPVSGITGSVGAGNYIQTNSTGILRWSASTSGTIFPVGDASYNPIMVHPQSSADVYDVKATDGVTDGSNVQQTANAVNVTWTVKPTSTSSQGVVVTPQWTSSSPNQELSGFSNTSSSDDVEYRTSTSSAWTHTTAGTPTNSSPIFSLASGNPSGVSDITMVIAGTPTYFISIGDPAPLPVTLISFNALYMNGAVNLDWETASEINNSHFELERSVNGLTWNTIGSVAGNGNSQTMIAYAYTDNLQGIVPAGTLYYRLKQVDFNGTFAYSDIKTANIAAQAASVETYPNPTTDLVNIRWTSANDQSTVLSIKDMSGKELYKEVVSGSGANTRQIDMTQFKTGTYFVELVSNDTVTSKMISRR
jgi:hypothetical protein